MKQTIQKIEITHRTIIFTVFFLIALYAIYLIRDVLILLFIATLFSLATSPLVEKLATKKIPRSLSAALIYLLFLGLIVLAIAGIVPPLIKQTSSLISQIPIPPELAENIRTLNIDLQDIQIIANQLTSIPKVLGVLGSAFSAVAIILTVGIMAFYILMEKNNIHKYLVWLFGNNAAEKTAENFVQKIESQIGGWVVGEAALMLVVGVLTYIGLAILNIPFSVPLAIIAGLLEIVPNLGPTLSAIPAIIIAFITTSPAMGIAVTALYILVQQLENNFIVPFVMRKAVGLSPIITILLILIGFRLGGIVGAILAIPIFLTIKITIQEFYRLRQSS